MLRPAPVARLGPFLVLSVLLLGAAPAPPLGIEPATPSRVAAPPDTLQSSVSAGAPLVRSLPSTLNGTPVARYTMLNGPSLSGVAGHSMTWITRDVAPGTYGVHLKATHPEAPPDTLVVQVEIQSE